MISRFRRTGALVAAATTAVLVLAGCAQPLSGSGRVALAPDVNLHVVDDSHSDFDQTVQNALSDVMTFWRAEYPKISGGKSLPPIRGGFYSVDGAKIVATRSVPSEVSKEGCIAQSPGFIIDNAAYCSADDSIVWDRSPDHLVPVLQKTYGPLLTAIVFAHEFGHAIQGRLGIFGRGVPVVRTESQADCAAGAFIATLFKGQAAHFRATPEQLDEALLGYLQVRDSTSTSTQDFSHGNGFDRFSAIANGINKGVTFCYSSTYLTDVTFTERPYVTDNDYATGGNEPLSQVLNAGTVQQGGGGLQPSLNAYWQAQARTVGKTFQPVKIAEAAHPKCGSESPDSEFGYCPDDNTVYYSSDFAKQAYYSLQDKKIDSTTAAVTILKNQPADFALGVLFSIGWGLAVRHQLFSGEMNGTTALNAAICYSGAYAKSINIAQPTQTNSFVLSPADLDEASSAMLNLVGQPEAYGARGQSGLDRVQSFVKGYHGGLSVCG